MVQKKNIKRREEEKEEEDIKRKEDRKHMMSMKEDIRAITIKQDQIEEQVLETKDKQADKVGEQSW